MSPFSQFLRSIWILLGGERRLYPGFGQARGMLEKTGLRASIRGHGLADEIGADSPLGQNSLIGIRKEVQVLGGGG
ncbi:MAG: hypothetical protein WAK03_15670 [Methylocystis sp.]